MIKLTQQREIAPYAWVHPDDDNRLIEAALVLFESYPDPIGLPPDDATGNAQRRQAEYDRSATLLSYRTLKIPRQ
jgi:hypothetical protein